MHLSLKNILQAAWLTLLSCGLGYSQRIITTVAGNDWIFPGDGKPALSAPLGEPDGLILDQHGGLYVTDAGNHWVQRIDANAIVRLVAGNGIPAFTGDN